jgi:glycosyltransferase involved in cell wall biosynthesis
MINILYLSYDGMTDPLGQSQVLPYLIGLAKAGYQITLISCEKKKPFEKNETLITTICTANNIDWQPIFYTKNPPVLSTLWDIIKLNKKTKELHKKKQFKLIHCRSYIPALIGLAFKKKHGVKFLFDMRGFWADERVDGYLWNVNKPHYKWIFNFFKKKEKEFLAHADKVVSLTENGKSEMLSWNIPELTENKIKVIPCAADYDLFELITPKKREQAKINLGIESSQFVLSYVGSLGTWYLVEEMMHFFSVLKQQYPTAKFLFLTPDKKEVVTRLANKYKLNETDLIIKFSERKDIPKYIHASDFSIFFIKPAYSKKSSSPTKMGELMAMGIPIICNSNVGDVELIMNQCNAGFCLNDLKLSSYEDIVMQLDRWNKNTPENIRENSKQFYDLKNGLNSYTSLYNELTQDVSE